MSTSERLELREEYRPLFRTLSERVLARRTRGAQGGIVVGIAGESGSGKSVTSKGLERELIEHGVRVCVLHQDDYFLLPPKQNHGHRCESLDNVGPHEVNLDLLQSHITAFRERQAHVTCPSVSYATDSFGEKDVDFSGADVLIVEGTYVLRLDDLDLRIFLEATHEDTRDRRRERARDIDAPIIDRILQIEHDIIAAQARRADVRIDRDFSVRDDPHVHADQ